MERTHRELCTGFTNRLRGNHTDRLADVHQVTSAQITSVAMRAQTMTRFARQRCADTNFVHAELVDIVDQIFVQQGSCSNCSLLCIRIHDVYSSHATKDALAQRLDYFTAFNQGFHRVAVRGTAVVFGDNQVLCHVNETTRQVAGVCCLQCRIGQTFTCTVCRDEVLEYVQAFTEVCSDWCLDDGAVWLGHEASHPG